jgi:hypothetical protein
MICEGNLECAHNVTDAGNSPKNDTLKGRLYPKRGKGRRPRMRWLDDVVSDLKKMKVKG